VFIAPGVTGTLIEDTTIHGQDTGNNAVEYANQNGGDSSTTALRVDLYNCTECYLGPGTLRNSYADVSAVVAGSHYEDTYYGGGDDALTIDHDTLLNPQPQTAAVYTYSDFGQVTNLTISNSLLAGGGYTIYGGGSTATGVTVTNNHFSRIYYPNGGHFGLSAAMNWDATDWTANIWDDSGHPADG
jgi:hypothetical protein